MREGYTQISDCVLFGNLDMQINWDLRGFGLSLQLLVHVSVRLSASWVMKMALSGFLWEAQIAVSSANILVLVLGLSANGKSLQYTEYRMGTKRSPVGLRF